MPSFSVRFKGMLTKRQLELLAAAGIEVAGSEPSMKLGSIKTGPPIYTVRVEAPSPEEALAKVRETLEPDTVNFSEWGAGPIQPAD